MNHDRSTSSVRSGSFKWHGVSGGGVPRAPADWRSTIRRAERLLREGKTSDAIAALLPTLRWRYDTARNEAIALLVSLGRPAEPELLEKLHSAHTAVERRSAADALGLMRSRRAVPALLRALGDPHMVVRRSASLALLRLRATEAVPRIARLVRDESGGVRVLAVGVLGRFADPAAVPSLIRALRDEKWYVRQEAARALGELRDSRAVPALRRAQSDARPAVARAASEALAAIA